MARPHDAILVTLYIEKALSLEDLAVSQLKSRVISASRKASGVVVKSSSSDFEQIAEYDMEFQNDNIDARVDGIPILEMGWPFISSVSTNRGPDSAKGD